MVWEGILPVMRTRISIIFWPVLMLAWLAAACGLLAPLDGLRPAEEVTATAEAAPAESTPTPAPAPVSGGLRLGTRVIEERQGGDAVVIYLQYPRLEGGNAAEGFNQAVADLLASDLAGFKAGVEAMPPSPETSPGPSTFLSGYTVRAATEALVSASLQVSQYASGAAHPLPYTVVVNYDLLNGRLLELDDLFRPGSDYIERLAELARADLNQRGMLFFEQGVEARAENFRAWAVSPEGLVVIFDVYQVAPYAAGAQEVVIPFEQIEAMINPAMLEMLKAAPVEVESPSVPVVYPQASEEA